MYAKLTLNMDADIVAEAKLYAQTQGLSLSQIVSDYFSILMKKSIQKPDNANSLEVTAVEEIPPITKSLWGLLEGANVDRQTYRDYLSEKYL